MVCDHCGQTITDAKAASAVWLTPEPRNGHGQSRQRIYFVHQVCNETFQQTAFTEAEQHQICTAGLAAFLMHLLANAGLPQPDSHTIREQIAERIASSLSQRKPRIA
jgi:hypothetical protein